MAGLNNLVEDRYVYIYRLVGDVHSSYSAIQLEMVGPAEQRERFTRSIVVYRICSKFLFFFFLS
jgi:hypothetical protein